MEMNEPDEITIAGYSGTFHGLSEYVEGIKTALAERDELLEAASEIGFDDPLADIVHENGMWTACLHRPNLSLDGPHDNVLDAYNAIRAGRGE